MDASDHHTSDHGPDRASDQGAAFAGAFAAWSMWCLTIAATSHRCALPDCTVETRENKRRFIHFDCFFNIVEAGGKLHIDWDYATTLFSEEMINEWIDQLIGLLSALPTQFDEPIDDIQIERAPLTLTPAQSVDTPAAPKLSPALLGARASSPKTDFLNGFAKSANDEGAQPSKTSVTKTPKPEVEPGPKAAPKRQDAEAEIFVMKSLSGVMAQPAPRTEKNLRELLAAELEQCANRDAIIFEDTTITHAELHKRSNQFANYLIAGGARQGDVVGVFMNRSIDLVVVMLGCWKAGVGYLPLDPSNPEERLRFMVADADAACIVTHNLAKDHEFLENADHINIDDISDHIRAQSDADPTTDIKIDCLAYILYTSGSTGKPKGVMNTHGAVINFLKSMAKTPGVLASDRLLALATPSFDISILEIFAPLMVGGTLIMANEEQTQDGWEIAKLIEAHHVTILQATPSTWRMLLESEWAGNAHLKALSGGEPLPKTLCATLLPKVQSLWNMYGPTETTVWSTCGRIFDAEDIHAGTPIDNTKIYVVDDDGALLPKDTIGELWIGGDGVAIGYKDREELSAEKFIRDPFDGAKGARAYKTGDLASINAYGEVDILGRRDAQIKLRGHRIELTEIEAALEKNDAIAQAAASVQEDSLGDDVLVAHYVLRDGHSVTGSELRRFLRNVLPSYMLPQFFVELGEMPLTPNRKLDRRALPPVPGAEKELTAFEAPRTPIEEKIAEIWASLLSSTKIGVTDNFFELGGQSLQVAQMLVQIRKTYGVSLPPRVVIYETLEQIGKAIEVARQSAEAKDAAG